ncbi:class I SAM-dependent methyltransferase [Rhodococcus phenolicus]|uniref:class I SAM-dependent methyltransferase n=1 Tax=Rhodococcus phenolicus TaxID=263849 RepID=UPI00082DA228|nr:class I SAM-dependent methyltransferase [Rhodococcus phenolicus]
MSWAYRLAYRVGFTPWEHALGPRGAHFDALVETVAGPGRALDVGCGSGELSIRLARRGWDVTGIDNVPAAIETATAAAAAAGVAVRFVEGDVTAMADVVGAGYGLLVDFGCFHGLTGAERAAYRRQVDRVSLPDATLMMFAFEPHFRGPLPRGTDRAEIERIFAGWSVEDEVSVRAGFHAKWYRLVRR